MEGIGWGGGRTACLLSQALNPAPAGSTGHFHNPGHKSRQIGTQTGRLQPQTHREKLLSGLSSLFPTLLKQPRSSSRGPLPVSSPPTAAGPWGPAKSVPETVTPLRPPLSDSRLCPPSRRPQSSLEMSLE